MFRLSLIKAPSGGQVSAASEQGDEDFLFGGKDQQHRSCRSSHGNAFEKNNLCADIGGGIPDGRKTQSRSRPESRREDVFLPSSIDSR